MPRYQKGTKAQRQNQHMRRLISKIKKFEKKGKDASGLEKELSYMMGEDRPAFKTGFEANSKNKKYIYGK